MDRFPFQFPGPVGGEMSAPFRDQHALVTGQGESQLTRFIPAVFRAAAGEAKIEHIEGASGRDVAVCLTRPGNQVITERHG